MASAIFSIINEPIHHTCSASILRLFMYLKLLSIEGFHCRFWGVHMQTSGRRMNCQNRRTNIIYFSPLCFISIHPKAELCNYVHLCSLCSLSELSLRLISPCNQIWFLLASVKDEFPMFKLVWLYVKNSFTCYQI